MLVDRTVGSWPVDGEGVTVDIHIAYNSKCGAIIGATSQLPSVFEMRDSICGVWGSAPLQLLSPRDVASTG